MMMLVYHNIFQKHLSNVSQKHGILDYGKNTKRPSEQNWTNQEYHVKNNEDVDHQDVEYIVLQISFLNCHFVAHTTNHMVYAD